MTSSLTVRLPAGKRARIRQKAKSLGMTESEFVRQLLDREIEPKSRAEKLKALAGSVSLKGLKMDGWQKSIRANNWRM